MEITVRNESDEWAFFAVECRFMTTKKTVKKLRRGPPEGRICSDGEELGNDVSGLFANLFHVFGRDRPIGPAELAADLTPSSYQGHESVAGVIRIMLFGDPGCDPVFHEQSDSLFQFECSGKIG